MSKIVRSQPLDSDQVLQSEQISIFSYLLGQQWNKYCADCSARSPTWASIDFGSFICIDCAGAHRALGPTITRVRSTNLDIWKKSWMYHMVIGNDRINQYWEADLIDQKRKNLKLKYNSARAERQRYAVVKYVRSKYVFKDKQNPMVSLKLKINDDKKLRMNLMDKIKSLQQIRDHQVYVQNHYERVLEHQSGKKILPPTNPESKVIETKPFDFFQDVEEPSSPIVKVAQPPIPAKIPQVSLFINNLTLNLNPNQNLNNQNIFPITYSAISAPISQLTSSLTQSQGILSPQINNSMSTPSFPLNFSFFSSPSSTSIPAQTIPLSSSQNKTVKSISQNSKPKSTSPSIFSSELQLISFDDQIYKKPNFTPISILPQNTYPSSNSYNFNLNTEPIPIYNPSFNLKTNINQSNSKYESFNEFNW